METVTIEKLKAFANVATAIAWAFQQTGEYPQRPKKPVLQPRHGSIEATQYGIDLQVWEKDIQDYNERLAVWNADSQAITDVVVDFIKDEAGLSTVPKQYQDKLYSKANEDGHSSGYYEVYLKLNSLIEIFE